MTKYYNTECDLMKETKDFRDISAHTEMSIN